MHLLGGVDGEATARTVVVLHTHAVRVEIATGLVASAGAVHTVRALDETRALAGVRSVSGGDGVGLPDIHLRAASTHVTSTRVGRGASPASNVGLENVSVSCELIT